MLNTFPELLDFGLMSPFILRVTLAVILISVGYLTLTKKKMEFDNYFKSQKYPFPAIITTVFGISEIVVGLFFFAGFYTQIISLISIYLLINLIYIENKSSKILPYTSAFYLILGVIALSLLFSGAGFFALDLPL